MERPPTRAFADIAAIGFVLTLSPDLTVAVHEPGATGGQAAVLIAMHAATAAVIAPRLTAVPARMAVRRPLAVRGLRRTA